MVKEKEVYLTKDLIAWRWVNHALKLIKPNMLKFLCHKSKIKRIATRVRNAYAMEFRAAFELSIMLRVHHVLKQ